MIRGYDARRGRVPIVRVDAEWQCGGGRGDRLVAAAVAVAIVNVSMACATAAAAAAGVFRVNNAYDWRVGRSCCRS